MKNTVTAILIAGSLLCCSVIDVAADERKPATRTVAANQSGMTINPQDTVFFDIAQAMVIGNSIEIPVYIRSDDPVNALDFSFKYDHFSCDYDTTVNLTGYIDMLTNYNTNDSTVYFTSYSFTQTYVNDTPLVKVKFTMIAGAFSAANLYGISAYLNGDACSYAIVGTATGLNEDTFASLTAVYPNPASNEMTITAPEPVTAEIISADGTSVVLRSSGVPLQQHTFDLSNVAGGIYLVRIRNGNSAATRKVVISR